MKEREGRIASKIESRNLVVFSILRESKYSECNQQLSKGNFLFKEGERGLCTSCADLDELVYLPSEDAALTLRARRYSPFGQWWSVSAGHVDDTNAMVS